MSKSDGSVTVEPTRGGQPGTNGDGRRDRKSRVAIVVGTDAPAEGRLTPAPPARTKAVATS